MSAAAYMSQPVVYGGVIVSRGAMIADLTRIAEASGHPNPQALVSRYVQGHAR